MTKRICSKEEALQLVEKFDHFLLDCDGVLWLDTVAIHGAVDFVDWLQKRNKSIAFVTNNSSKSRDAYLTKFSSLGFRNIEKSEIYPTCYSAALILEKLSVPKNSKIWVFGDVGIEETLRECGYIPIGGTDPALDCAWDPNSPLLEVDPEVKAVVVGSTKELNYMRACVTIQYLLAQDKSLPFIGCNIDRTYPGPKGKILPAGGSLVNFMSYTADRDFINVGKPSVTFLETILADQKFDPCKTLMIGDTLYTDIKFGNDGNLGGTLLVLSGGTLEKDLDNFDDESLEPDYVIGSLGHLFELIK